MRRRVLLAAALLGCATVAQATPILVTITGTYPSDVVGTALPYISQDFMFTFLSDLNPVPTTVEGTTAFIITPDVNYYAGGAFAGTFTTRSVGWFFYPDDNYAGIDLRLNNWIGDEWYQIVIPFPEPGFTGPVSAPTLSLSNLSGLSAAFYELGTSPNPGNFWASNVTYSASEIPQPVPEPASTLVLFGLGVACIAGYAGRSQPR